MSKSTVVILFLLFYVRIRVSAEGAKNSYQLSHLLKQQIRFEINLILPDFNLVSTRSLPSSLLRSMEYLGDNQAPFRLYYNSSQRIQPPPMIRCSRYAENQVAHLIFLMLQTKDEIVDLNEVFQSCVFHKGFASTAIHKDLIQLILDSNLNDLWELQFYVNVPPEQLPLNFVIFNWSGTALRISRPLLVRETCKCDGIPSLTFLRTNLARITQQNGMQVLKNEIRNTKTNFQGRKLIIRPNKQVFGPWKSWKTLLRMYSLRKAHENAYFAFGGILFYLKTAHNFTFDAVKQVPLRERSSERPEGVISMGISWNCHSLTECLLPPLPLNHFGFFRTFSISQPTQTDPFDLSCVAAPFHRHHVTAVMLATASIALTLTFFLLTGKWNLVETSLAALAGLIGKSWDGMKEFRAELYYSFWLLMVGFVSMGYTNVLESILVVPSVQRSGRTFEDMLQANFSFETTHFSYIKSQKIQITKEEKHLVKLVVESQQPYPFSWRNFIERFGEGKGNVLVADSNNVKNLGWIPTVLKVDLVVGKERFFNFPSWWGLSYVERASLIAESIEISKEVGILSYFLQLHESKRSELNAQSARMEFLAARESVEYHDMSDEWSKLTLKDGLVSESFVLFLYGISLASVAFVIEILAKLLSRSISLLQCIWFLHCQIHYLF